MPLLGEREVHPLDELILENSRPCGDHFHTKEPKVGLKLFRMQTSFSSVAVILVPLWRRLRPGRGQTSASHLLMANTHSVGHRIRCVEPTAAPLIRVASPLVTTMQRGPAECGGAPQVAVPSTS